MILGHERQQEQLKSVFDQYERGAFLLVGPEGVGKQTLVEDRARESLGASGVSSGRLI